MKFLLIAALAVFAAAQPTFPVSFENCGQYEITALTSSVPDSSLVPGSEVEFQVNYAALPVPPSASLRFAAEASLLFFSLDLTPANNTFPYSASSLQTLISLAAPSDLPGGLSGVSGELAVYAAGDADQALYCAKLTNLGTASGSAMANRRRRHRAGRARAQQLRRTQNRTAATTKATPDFPAQFSVCSSSSTASKVLFSANPQSLPTSGSVDVQIDYAPTSGESTLVSWNAEVSWLFITLSLGSGEIEFDPSAGSITLPALTVPDGVPSGVSAKGKITVGDKLCVNSVEVKTGDGSFTMRTPHPALVGGARPGARCIGSAGYVWCSRFSRCVRPWELSASQRQGADVSTAESFATFCEAP